MQPNNIGGLGIMKPAITDIPGVGPVAADALAEHRITTVLRLSRSSIEQVAAVPGFSEARAAKVIAAAAELLGTAAGAPSTEDSKSQQGAGDSPDIKGSKGEKGKKDKNGKKGKGKNKGKGKDKDSKKGKGKGKGKGKNKKKGKK
jgi:hypothetical protein